MAFEAMCMDPLYLYEIMYRTLLKIPSHFWRTFFQLFAKEQHHLVSRALQAATGRCDTDICVAAVCPSVCL